MTANQTHGWSEGQAKRAGSSRDEAWLIHQICRVVAQELEEPIRALHERPDAIEKRLNERQAMARTAFTRRQSDDNQGPAPPGNLGQPC